MDSLQIFILSLVQGLTEFLPISSSAHLILAPMVFGFTDQGLAFDVAVHVGSLAAVSLYFRAELFAMGRDFFASLRKSGDQTENSRIAWMVIIATLPIVVVGKLIIGLIEDDLRSIAVISTTTILFGLALYWADQLGKKNRNEYSTTWKEALFIGTCQVFALIPGTSRSGITITAGMMLGMSRQAASRFSFLLSIPTIAMSGGLVTLKLAGSTLPVNWLALLSGAALSFVSAYLCIHLFLRLIDRVSMTPFVIYRLLLGGGLIWIFFY